MSIYLVVPLLVSIAVLQTSVVSRLIVWGISVDLPLLVVVGWGLLRGARDGVIWGFVAGIAVDLLSGAPFGAATLSLMCVGFLAGLGRSSVFGAHVAFPILAVFVATVVYDVLFLLIVQVAGQTVGWLESLYRVVLPSAVLNSLLMPVVYAILRVLHLRFGREEMEW